MMYDLIVRGGRVVLPGRGVFEADVGVSGERIAALLAPNSTVSARQVLDARGLHVFPGLIDPHVHPGVYKPMDKDYPDLTRFAARGGVTALQHFIRGNRALLEVLPREIARMERLGAVDFSFNPSPLTKEQVAELPTIIREYGITSFKFYAGYKGVEKSRFGVDQTLDDGFMAEIMGTLRDTGADPVLMVHCENMDLAYWVRARVSKGFAQTLAHFEAESPVVAEAEFIWRTFYLGQNYGVPTYAVHLSAGTTADLAPRVPWFDPERTILETCPHYLVLDTDAAAGLGAVVKPPLRKRGEQEGLWEGIRRGVISTIGSDNCSTPLDLKKDITNCNLGFGELGFTLPILLSEGYHRRGISLERIAAVTSGNVARIMGWAPHKGDIRPGVDADLVLVDLQREQAVDSRAWKGNEDGSVYEGMRLKGWPVATISRGEVIVREGEYVGRPGRGRFVRRTLPSKEV